MSRSNAINLVCDGSHFSLMSFMVIIIIIKTSGLFRCSNRDPNNMSKNKI